MKACSANLFFLLALVVASDDALAQTDRVRLVGGGSEAGRVTATTRDAVTLEQSGETLDIPTHRIKAILFGGEPTRLMQAKISVATEGYETVLESLDEVSLRGVDNALVEQDVQFLKALAKTRLAIVDAYDRVEAGRELTAFVRDHRDSHHFYEAVESLGDLNLSMGRFDRAESMYAQIAKSSVPAIRARAFVLAARASQAQGEHEEALQRFDAAVRQAEGDSDTRREAVEGKATSLAALGRLDEGLDLARDAVRDAPDDAARGAAYNTLGRCYEAADRPTDALLAYLHTDLLFDGEAPAHAEALARLADLWRGAGKPDAARDAARRLRRRYAATKWARGAPE